VADLPRSAMEIAWRRGFDAGFCVLGAHIANPYLVSALSRAWGEGYAKGRACWADVDHHAGSIDRDADGMPIRLYPAVGMRDAIARTRAARSHPALEA
jgi:hypothetical protein